MPEVTPICQFGAKASDFKLQGTDEKVYTLDHFKGKNGTLIMFICNHCPYVKGVINRLVKDIEKIQKVIKLHFVRQSIFIQEIKNPLKKFFNN